MDKKLIEEQAERVTNLFSYRGGYSTPKDAYISAVEWTLARISDWINQRMKGEAPPHDQQLDFRDGFIEGLCAVDNYLELKEK